MILLHGSYFCAGFGYAVSATFIVAIVDRVPALVGRFFPQNPAKAMARLTLTYGAAQITAPMIAGLMAKVSGDYRGALFIAAGVMAAGVGLLALMDRKAAPPSWAR